MAEMRLSTEERISRLSRRNQPPPQIIEFLDMAATSHAKVKAVCMCVPARVHVCARVVYNMTHGNTTPLLQVAEVEEHGHRGCKWSICAVEFHQQSV